MYDIRNCADATVIGLAIRTSNTEAFETIPAHWQRFFGEDVLARIPQRLSADVLAIYNDFDHAGQNNLGQYSFVIGAEVAPDAPVPEGLVKVRIPGARCAVFEVERGHPERVGEAWQRIWATDLPKSYRCEHERYLPDGQISIHIGLR